METQTTTQEKEPRTINGVGIVPVVPRDLSEANSLATTLAKSSLLPTALRGKPGDVLVMLLAGLEMGMSPMQSIRGFHVIQGKPVMSADLMSALVKRSPSCLYFQLVTTSGEKATYCTKRVGEEETSLTFTIEEARNAGLLGNDNWKKYPAAMLRARAASALARAVYPDLVLGIYTPDELGSLEVIDATPPAQLGNGAADEEQVIEAEVVDSVADEVERKREHARFFAMLNDIGMAYQTPEQKKAVRDSLKVLVGKTVYSLNNLSVAELRNCNTWLQEVIDCRNGAEGAKRRAIPQTWRDHIAQLAEAKASKNATTDESLEGDLQASIEAATTESEGGDDE